MAKLRVSPAGTSSPDERRLPPALLALDSGGCQIAGRLLAQPNDARTRSASCVAQRA